MDAIDPTEPSFESQCEALGDLLRLNFIPVTTAGDATNMLTTDQLYRQVEEHAPGLIDARDFRKAMLQLGYVEITAGSIFVWLLGSR